MKWVPHPSRALFAKGWGFILDFQLPITNHQITDSSFDFVSAFDYQVADMRKHLIIAAILLALVAWLGFGIIGAGPGMFCPFFFLALAITEKQQRRRHFVVALIYLGLLVATITVLVESAKLAKRRAVPVIAAVNRYHAENGRYPATLNDLVPTYLPAIPHAGFTRGGRDFYYGGELPSLSFAGGAGPGMFYYDFSTQSWQASD